MPPSPRPRAVRTPPVRGRAAAHPPCPECRASRYAPSDAPHLALLEADETERPVLLALVVLDRADDLLRHGVLLQCPLGVREEWGSGLLAACQN